MLIFKLISFQSKFVSNAENRVWVLTLDSKLGVDTVSKIRHLSIHDLLRESYYFIGLIINIALV